MADEDERAQARDAAMGVDQVAEKLGTWLVLGPGGADSPHPRAHRITVSLAGQTLVQWGVPFSDFGRLVDFVGRQKAPVVVLGSGRLVRMHGPCERAQPFLHWPGQFVELATKAIPSSVAFTTDETEMLRPVLRSVNESLASHKRHHDKDAAGEDLAKILKPLVRLVELLLSTGHGFCLPLPPETTWQATDDPYGTKVVTVTFKGPWVTGPGCTSQPFVGDGEA